MSIPELIGQGPSPSKFGPGFGAKTRSLRFFTGHEDRRYPFPGELGMNEHLKGRFGAELSIMLPSGFGVALTWAGMVMPVRDFVASSALAPFTSIAVARLSSS